MILGEKIVAKAESYLGVRFRHQGRSRHGVDCLGLLICVARELGFDPPDDVTYDRQASGKNLVLSLARYKYLRKVLPEEISAGDCVVFHTGDGPKHLAICTGTHIIHSYQPAGKVVKNTLDPWRPKIRGVFRLIKE